MSQSTAILVFTHSAAEEGRRKQFIAHAGSVTNAAIASRLIKHTLREVKKSRLPFFISWAELQQGITFGERLAHAFGKLFNEGYEHVICIGNDAPELKARHLKAAAALLSSHKQVIGPDCRGGAYLIGISKSQFEQEAICALPWNSSHVFHSLCEWISSSPAGYEVLERLDDVNAASDFQKLFQSKRNSLFLLRYINSMLSRAFAGIRETTRWISSPFLLAEYSRRGPPLF